MPSDARTQNFVRNRHEHFMERSRLRMLDIEESRNLLLELALYEPNICHCFGILVNACLTEDIDITVKGRNITDEFHKYVNTHYQSFCADAIRCIFIYGFVPWYPRKLVSGDIVPMILPHGTFTWHVEGIDRDLDRRHRLQEAAYDSVSSSGNKKDEKEDDKKDKKDDKKDKKEETKKDSKNIGDQRTRWEHLKVPRNDNESKLVQNRVRITGVDIDPTDVFLYDVYTPCMNIVGNSNIYATVSSPLAHLVSDYKNIRDAQMRRSYADAWNTTARIFTSCIPPAVVSNEPTHSYLYYETGSDRSRLNQGRHYMESRHKELENQIAQPSNHVPSLYNLPVHHRIEQLSALSPCEDVNLLLEKFRRDVASLLGIPFDLAYGHNTGQQTAGSTEIHSRTFSNTVLRICHILQELIKDIYCKIYECEKGNVEVVLNPMPRLDIHSMADLKILFEIGAITPDITAQLSEILLLGERTNVTGKKRKTTHEGSEYMTNLKKITEATNPPKPPPKPAAKKKKTTKKK